MKHRKRSGWRKTPPHTGLLSAIPKDKEEITQVPYEPWHLRYVGRVIAGYIKRTGLSLEEFTEQWQAALHTFLADGGNEQTQLLMESTEAPSTVESTVLGLTARTVTPRCPYVAVIALYKPCKRS